VRRLVMGRTTHFSKFTALAAIPVVVTAPLGIVAGTPAPNSTSSDDDEVWGMPQWAFITLIVGVVVLVAALLAFIYAFSRTRKQRDEEPVGAPPGLDTSWFDVDEIKKGMGVEMTPMSMNPMSMNPMSMNPVVTGTPIRGQPYFASPYSGATSQTRTSPYYETGGSGRLPGPPDTPGSPFRGGPVIFSNPPKPPTHRIMKPSEAPPGLAVLPAPPQSILPPTHHSVRRQALADLASYRLRDSDRASPSPEPIPIRTTEYGLEIPPDLPVEIVSTSRRPNGPPMSSSRSHRGGGGGRSGNSVWGSYRS